MFKKTWNVRDQTTTDLNDKIEKIYKEIEKDYKLLKKLSNLDDAKRMLDGIWTKKAQANNIQMELIRREYSNEAQTEDDWEKG